MCPRDDTMSFQAKINRPMGFSADRTVYLPTYDANANRGGVAAQLQSDPKKQGKEKKPDINLDKLVFPDRS